MAKRNWIRSRGPLSRGAGTISLVKLAEGPLHLCGKITRPLAIPAHVDLVEGRAIERSGQVATRGVAPVGLSPDQFFAQCGYPAAQGAQKSSAEVGLLKHQAQHLPGLPGVMHFFLQDGENGILKRRQRLASLWHFRKSLRYPLAEVLYAKGEQLLLGFEIAEKCAPGYSRIAADLFHRRPVETHRSEQIPGGPFNLLQHELVFPLAKRPGILRFRHLFAAESVKRFLHCMQIMAQSAVS
jgi:hypothetical protein